MRRTFCHLTFANVASAIALFVALSGGTAVALSAHSGPAANDPAAACSTSPVLTIHAGDPDQTICAVGPLTLTAHCAQLSERFGLGSLRLTTATTHTFVSLSGFSGDANLGPADPPFSLVFTTDSVGGGGTVHSGDLSFEAAASPAAGGAHLGGTAAVRTHAKSTAPFTRCQFAVDALTS
jgi:hypothetical protein